MTTAQRATHADLMAHPEDDYLYQLVRGEIVRMPPPQPGHGDIEAGIRFTLPDGPDQIRGVDMPSLGVEQFRRLEPSIRGACIPEVPALVAEIISPADTTAYSTEKVTDYLQGGAQLVWQLYPKTQSVRVYTGDNRTWTVLSDGLLDGAPVLPGFSVLVAELFP